MGDPFDQAIAQRYVLAILKNDMTSADAVNVLREGHVGRANR